MKHTIALPLLIAATASGAAHADNGLAIGGGIGTTGGVVEGYAQVTPFFQFRGGYNWLEYEADDTYDDIAYAGDLDMSTLGAFLDVRPFGNSFVLTGGAYFGDKGLDLTGMPTQDVEIGGETFTPAEVGMLSMQVDLEETAPFLGFGWDTTFQGSGPFGVKLLIGAMYTGSPSVDLSAAGGTLSGDPGFQAELADEERNLEADVDDYEYYPVIQAGLTWRF